MPIFEVSKSYNAENPTRPFFVKTLKDVSGNDLTHYIESSASFRDHTDLKNYLSSALQIPSEDIYVLDMM